LEKVWQTPRTDPSCPYKKKLKSYQLNLFVRNWRMGGGGTRESEIRKCATPEFAGIPRKWKCEKKRHLQYPSSPLQRRLGSRLKTANKGPRHIAALRRWVRRNSARGTQSGKASAGKNPPHVPKRVSLSLQLVSN